MSQSASWTAQASDGLAEASRPAIDNNQTVVARLNNGLSSVPSSSSTGLLPSPSFRSTRTPRPSPLSSIKAASTPASPTEYQGRFQPIDGRCKPSDLESAEQTTFYTDSSAAPSPEPASPQFRPQGQTNATRSVSDPLKSKPAGSSKPPRLPMAGPVAVAQGEAAKGLPRNSSIDSAISAMSSKSHPSSSDGAGSPDIVNLIKTAGSAEAVIQYLLKEKQSQSQQNSQLWRLVDKQRAMILGLNKDLERALKDKERYRTKLKEVMAASTVSKPAGDNAQGRRAEDSELPRVDIHSPKEQTAFAPDSPILENDSHKASPIHMAMAPYPITPPADHVAAPASAVREALDPAHAMPKPQEHALGQYDHEELDRAEDQARKERADEGLESIPFNVGLPPSRSLPTEPPKMPPPKPPVANPTLSVVEATPDPSEGLSQFPVPPPRKPPPAPLQLKKDLRPDLGTPPNDEDTDTDYDDLLEVDDILTEKRGRRRTRAEDDRVREIQAFMEAEARSASKKSKSSKPSSPEVELPKDSTAVPSTAQHVDTGATSLDAVMHGDNLVHRELVAPPIANAGLPASPRPMGMKNMASPPLSPRGVSAAIPAAPLSPRPPRQPIPLPPNTPLATPATNSAGDGLKSPKPLNIVKKAAEDGRPQSAATTTSSSPVERTKIYRGLVTEEYPDLLLPPNALPSIDVRVASSRMKPSRASLMSLTQLEEDPVFTLAVISRADRGELWRVEKDSASLSKLDARIKQCPTFTTKAPDRSLFSGHSPAKLDARRIALESYLDDLLNTPLDTSTALELCKYLSSNTLPPNADETGSAGNTPEEGSAHKLGPEGLPYRNGYLTKKGKNFGGWKARFFVLDGPHLKYYEAPGGAHLGTIKLPRAQIGKQSQSQGDQSPSRTGSAEDLDNQYRHAFLILEPKKKDSSSHVKHVLCAESDKERDLWVEALLQWIDYRDPDDDGPSSRPHPHERQAAAASERSNKSKKSSHPKQHQQADSDTLIGVRYDSTNAGEAPLGAPPRGKNGSHSDQLHTPHFADTMSSQTKLISGPKDGQVISDTAAWGNKASGLSIPNSEEKKARKRSFFGFGPKTRSSSDGQESLFGSDTGATPPQNAYHGPVRQAFGAPLAEAVRYNPPTDANVPLPAVVFRCIQYLDAKNAVLEEGIFRLSGSNVVIKQLRERFNTEGDINLLSDDQFYDMHAIASLLKLYLRELPTTILTRDLHLEFLATTEITNKTEKLAALNTLVQRLPQANGTLLKYLIAFLIKIINNADINKMTVRNVGIVFSPTLNIPAPVFALFLQNYEAIFGIEPDEYELPSPVSESEGFGRADAPLRFEPPARPLTSSGSASPQRQPRMESMPHYQRSTPTPPLTTIHQGSRGSPGSTGSRQMYESGYLAQQGGAQPVRAGYESNLGGYDSRGPPTQGFSAGYEDGSGGLAPYEQSYNGSSGSSKRRESAVFMGGIMGLQHQGSRSRLREETRF